MPSEFHVVVIKIPFCQLFNRNMILIQHNCRQSLRYFDLSCPLPGWGDPAKYPSLADRWLSIIWPFWLEWPPRRYSHLPPNLFHLVPLKVHHGLQGWLPSSSFFYQQLERLESFSHLLTSASLSGFVNLDQSFSTFHLFWQSEPTDLGPQPNVAPCSQTWAIADAPHSTGLKFLSRVIWWSDALAFMHGTDHTRALQ